MQKTFAKDVETVVKRKIIEAEGPEDLSIKELALIAKVFCKTRSAHRDFHKLLESTILMRMEELRKDLKVLHSIGFTFESSGLCSIDTIKALKKEMFQAELEMEVF